MARLRAKLTKTKRLAIAFGCVREVFALDEVSDISTTKRFKVEMSAATAPQSS